MNATISASMAYRIQWITNNVCVTLDGLEQAVIRNAQDMGKLLMTHAYVTLMLVGVETSVINQVAQE